MIDCYERYITVRSQPAFYSIASNKKQTSATGIYDFYSRKAMKGNICMFLFLLIWQSWVWKSFILSKLSLLYITFEIRNACSFTMSMNPWKYLTVNFFRLTFMVMPNRRHLSWSNSTSPPYHYCNQGKATRRRWKKIIPHTFSKPLDLPSLFLGLGSMRHFCW